MDISTEQTREVRTTILETILTRIHTESKTYSGVHKSDPSVPITVRYSCDTLKPCFTVQLEEAAKHLSMPFQINLLDADCDEDGILKPTALIIMPEYLVDVTSISGCFTSKGPDPAAYLMEKFRIRNTGISTLAGNIINGLTDLIIHTPNITFQEAVRKSFEWFPLELSFLSDYETAQLIQLIKPQFLTLLKTINYRFPAHGIDRNHISIEPSFYSRTYGIQGRLDLLYPGSKETLNHIIEVKSGKIYQPNKQGINQSHYIQTVLYHLLIRSVYHDAPDPLAYILYSRHEEQSLRNAKITAPAVSQSLWMRNAIVILDHRMTKHNEIETILAESSLSGCKMENSFLNRDILQVTDSYKNLNQTEKLYFNHQCAFISKEKLITKSIYNAPADGITLGSELTIRPTIAHSATTEERFLDKLTILENRASLADPILILNKSHNASSNSQIKAGEPAILFPSGNKHLTEAVFDNQVFKCTVLSIHRNHISVKLRKPQHHHTLFNQYEYWSILTENPENGYQAMYQSLSEWMNAPKSYRDLILGNRPPCLLHEKPPAFIPDSLTDNQQKIFSKVIRGSEYFLIWGPPGTGKTHIMLRIITSFLMEHTSENILLLAYTNRAVDEICESLFSNGNLCASSLIRIGSRQSTSSNFHGYLFDAFIRQCNTRQEVKQLLQNKRIYTATISSISNKKDLLRYKSFGTVIIDEASQIPEAMLCGLLHHFTKIILIGDHRQLPAVVMQSEQEPEKGQAELISSTSVNVRNSLFERLFRQACTMGWHHAYGLLSEQGRMHTHLMAFVNQQYYENQLKPFPGLKRQVAPYFLKNVRGQQFDLEERKRFIHIENTNNNEYKSNTAEAALCAVLVKLLHAMHVKAKREFHNTSVGIITPFRAQSARIQQILQEHCPDCADLITVDTVERYQGSARDIIIMSTCIGQPEQLSMITSISDEGIDRKLNVAITRAREQLIVLGNRNILTTNSAYKKLIEWLEIESVV
jgi:DNA replication ATP-dependent helicase Dna2